MQAAETLVGLFPWSFTLRLTSALVEIVLAAVLLSTSVVVGHELRDWRTWYADANHPWAPTARPTVFPSREAQVPLGRRP